MSRTSHRQADQVLALDSILTARVCTTSAANGTVEGRESLLRASEEDVL